MSEATTRRADVMNLTMQFDLRVFIPVDNPTNEEIEALRKRVLEHYQQLAPKGYGGTHLDRVAIVEKVLYERQKGENK